MPRRLPPGGANSDSTQESYQERVQGRLAQALEDVVLLAVLARNLANDVPLMPVRDVDSPVGVVLQPDLFVSERLLHLARVAGRPGCLRNAKWIHTLLVMDLE